MNIKLDIFGYDVDANVEYEIFGKFLPETQIDPAEYPEVEPTKLFLSDGTDATVLLNNNEICKIVIEIILDEIEKQN